MESTLRYLILAGLVALAGCSKSATQCTDNDGGLAPVGGPVPGPVDNHCYAGGAIAAQFTSQDACPASAGLYADGGPPASTITCGLFPDGGPAGCTPICAQPDGGPAGCAQPYGPTMYNNSGFDDDCKYQIAWWSSPVVENGNTTLYFTALHAIDGTPATGAAVHAEVFLPSANHLSPTLEPPVVETPAGSGAYSIGPVVFDMSGQWTVRFHLNEQCADLLPDSPHGHAAFYVHVP